MSTSTSKSEELCIKSIEVVSESSRQSFIEADPRERGKRCASRLPSPPCDARSLARMLPESLQRRMQRRAHREAAAGNLDGDEMPPCDASHPPSKINEHSWQGMHTELKHGMNS
eukprot:5778669-Pleurochrysis_carterae.AAC.7